MKRAICLLLPVVMFLVSLPACTHYYVKPGAGPAQFNRDKRDCERVAQKESQRKGTRLCDETERCLEAKGWRRD